MNSQVWLRGPEFADDEDRRGLEAGSPVSMPSLLELLQFRFRTIAIVAVATMVMLGLIDWSIGERYTGQVLVLIDDRQDKVVNIEEVLSGLPTDQPSILNQIQILKSSSLASQVISKLHLDADPERPTGAKHCRHRDRVHFGDRDAGACPSEAASCRPDWQRSHARRFQASRFLCLSFCHSLGRSVAECTVRLVVDGSSRRIGDGSDHRERGREWAPR
jgi:hypothetical protein